MSTTWTDSVSMSLTRRTWTTLDCQHNRSAASSQERTRRSSILAYTLTVPNLYKEDMCTWRLREFPTGGENCSMLCSVKWWSTEWEIPGTRLSKFLSIKRLGEKSEFKVPLKVPVSMSPFNARSYSLSIDMALTSIFSQQKYLQDEPNKGCDLCFCLKTLNVYFVNSAK